ncbi:MAG: DinB family protein [Planctomycetota bacterium]|jgi:hypothetical protein
MNEAADARALGAALNRLSEILHRPEERLYLRVPAVSAWSPAQQVEHILLALDGILGFIRTLQTGGDEKIQPQGSPRLAGRVVLWTGWIPRGRAEAPDFVVPELQPPRPMLRENLASVLEKSCQTLGHPAALQGIRGTWPHPLLGNFSASQWLRFARIHTEHHLSIIDDIERQPVVPERAEDPAYIVKESP